MSSHEREFLDQLRTQSIAAAAEILEGIQRLKTMYEEITDDGNGNPLPPPKIGDHFYQLAKFELEHASTLLRLGNSQAEMIFEHLRQFARRHQKAVATVLTLQPGSEGPCRGSFQVRNPFETKGSLRFEVGELKNAQGEVDLECKLKIQPVKDVGPRETVQIHVSAPVPTETRFGDLTVFFVGELEKQIANRVVKVVPVAET